MLTSLNYCFEGEFILTATKWQVSIEGKVILGTFGKNGSFTSALAVLFASYYNFILQSREGASTALEFIQSENISQN